MVDFHSHILPCIDDGSRNIEESLRLVHELKKQGVDTVVATPHFNADCQTVQSFIQKQSDAYDKLNSVLYDDDVKILTGAEVSFYEGISRLQGLEQLCVQGTNLLLVEMPCCIWGSTAVKELIQLSIDPDIRLIIAHGERYLPMQSDETVNCLLQNDVLIQTNASLYLRLIGRGRAIKKLKNGLYHLIGSDCHNMSSRPPRIGEAFKIIEKKLGSEFVNSMHAFAYSLINQ